MKRVNDFLLTDGVLPGNTGPIVNGIYGGQQGYSPVLGMIENGENVSSWISNQAYVRQNAIPVLIQAPEFFKDMPQPEKLVKLLKAMIETHAINIDGLDSTLTVETATHKAGAVEDQAEVVKINRALSAPKFTFVEKRGKLFQKFLELWIRYGLGSEDDNGRPLVNTLVDFKGKNYDAGYYTMTVLFIEPDVTFSNVVNAWLCGNMFPLTGGSNVGGRDLTASGEILNLDIDFTAITTPYSVAAVRELAEKVLDNISGRARAYGEHPTFVSDKDADVNDDAAQVGFGSTAENPS